MTAPRPAGWRGGAGLCLSCGLCCDGSLFWAVEIDGADAVPEGAAPGGRLAQPCSFHAGGACGIYATRPGQCRAFVCDVLGAVLDGSRDRAWAHTRIEAMRHLLAGLDDALPGQERSTPAPPPISKTPRPYPTTPASAPGSRSTAR
ncbi:MAG: hypothetical protein R3D59_15855 [Paracoccaceae bacterium]